MSIDANRRHRLQVPRISRRGFLTGMSVAAASTCCSRRLPEFSGSIVGPDMVTGHRWRDGGGSPANREERVGVVIVGGGVTGLAAAYQLSRQGMKDLVVLEMDSALGGNSRSGENRVSAYPWGAHYVALPGPEAHEVHQLFRELGIITGTEGDGRPIYREEYLCQDPMERLFIHGRWQEGILPNHGLTRDERAETERFLVRMDELKRAQGRDGRPVFAIPVDRSSRDSDWLGLDKLNMAAWMEREGFRAAPLRWYVDYCCRDDFGLGMDRISAWAGIHYFAARGAGASNAPSHAVVTWPEGNGWLVNRLRKPVSDRVKPRCPVWRVEPVGDAVHVECWDLMANAGIRFIAGSVILAVPRYVAARVFAPSGTVVGEGGPVYPPWMVANLVVDRLPVGLGSPVAWDNVIYDSRSLGYVVATHQHLNPAPRESVLTYYQPLDHAEPAQARLEAQKRTYSDWCELILDDLSRVHPEIRSLLRHLDVMVWGHGMAAPVPGFVWGEARARMQRWFGRIHLAHSDQSGISIFEEAFTRGAQAAAAVMGHQKLRP